MSDESSENFFEEGILDNWNNNKKYLEASASALKALIAASKQSPEARRDAAYALMQNIIGRQVDIDGEEEAESCFLKLRESEEAESAEEVQEQINAYRAQLQVLQAYVATRKSLLNPSLIQDVEAFERTIKKLEQDAAGVSSFKKIAEQVFHFIAAALKFLSLVAEQLPEDDVLEDGLSIVSEGVITAGSAATLAAESSERNEIYQNEGAIDNLLVACFGKLRDARASAKTITIANAVERHEQYMQACIELGEAVAGVDGKKNERNVELTPAQDAALRVIKTESIRLGKLLQDKRLEEAPMKDSYKDSYEAFKALDEGIDEVSGELTKTREAFDVGEVKKETKLYEEGFKTLETIIKQRNQRTGLHDYQALYATERVQFEVALPTIERMQGYEKEGQRLTLEYEQALKLLEEQKGPSHQIKEVKEKLAGLKVEFASTDLGFYQYALVPEEEAEDMNQAILKVFEGAERLSDLLNQPAFKKDLAALKEAMQAAALDEDVVVDEQTKHLFSNMKNEILDSAHRTHQKMDGLSQERYLSPVQRVALQALQGEIQVLERELGLPTEEERKAFEQRLGAKHTEEALLKDAIIQRIEPVEKAREALQVLQTPENHTVLEAHAKQVKSDLSLQSFDDARAAENDVLARAMPAVKQVVREEELIRTLIGRYDVELNKLKRRAASAEKGATWQGGSLSSEIKRREKILKGFEAWRAPSDLGDYASLSQAGVDFDETDKTVRDFVDIFDKKQAEFEGDEFKYALTLLNHSMKKVAEDKQVMLGEQEAGTYAAVKQAMEPWYEMKRQVEQVLAAGQKGKAVTVVQHAAFEALRDKMLAMESEFGLPSQDDLKELGEHCKPVMEGGEIFSTLEKQVAGVEAASKRAREYIEDALKLRGKDERFAAGELRQGAREAVANYKEFLNGFRETIRAFKGKDAGINEGLARLEKTLAELESNIDEPWDMQWAAVQMEIFMDGVKALASSGWEGLQSFGGLIQSGFGALLDMGAALKQKASDDDEVEPEELTEYQKQTEDTLSEFEQRLEAGLQELQQHKKVLLGMLPNQRGFNFFGRKRPTSEEFLQAKQAVNKQIDKCKQMYTAVGQEVGGLMRAHNKEGEMKLTDSQVKKCEGLYTNIYNMQQQTSLNQQEHAAVVMHEAKLTSGRHSGEGQNDLSRDDKRNN